jgi:hypothetical protein
MVAIFEPGREAAYSRPRWLKTSIFLTFAIIRICPRSVLAGSASLKSRESMILPLHVQPWWQAA